MQLDREAILNLQGISDYVARVMSDVARELHTAGDFYDGGSYELTDTLQFRYTAGVVAFWDVIPDKVLAVEVDAPIESSLLPKKTILDDWINDGATSEFYDHTWSEKKTRTEETDIVNDLIAGLEAKVGGGSPAFNAELKASVQDKLSTGHHETTGDEEEDRKSMKVEVPPFMQTTMTQTESISDVRQTVRSKCLLDAKVRVSYSTDWTIAFESLRSLELWLRGGGQGSGESRGDRLREITGVLQKYHADIRLPREPLIVEEERRYRNAQTGKSVRKDIPIEHGVNR